jgi:hypothetical protein
MVSTTELTLVAVEHGDFNRQDLPIDTVKVEMVS